jgi:hypothetical protein
MKFMDGAITELSLTDSSSTRDEKTSIFRTTDEKIDRDEVTASRSNASANQQLNENEDTNVDSCKTNVICDDDFKLDRQPEDGKVNLTSDDKLSTSLNKPRAIFDSDRSGTLRVYFLVIEGLSSTVSACPKNYQPQTLEMLFELMRLAARALGKMNAYDLISKFLKLCFREIY